MTKFAEWLIGLIKSFFTGLFDFVKDVFIAILDLLLSGVLALISAIPVPSFLSGGLNSALNAIGPDVWFFAGHFHLPECMAILGAAVTFRLARKAVTLFQW